MKAFVRRVDGKLRNLRRNGEDAHKFHEIRLEECDNDDMKKGRKRDVLE
jgi:hypothetical protein